MCEYRVLFFSGYNGLILLRQVAEGLSIILRQGLTNCRLQCTATRAKNHGSVCRLVGLSIDYSRL